MTMGDSAARIIPECVGLSLTLYDEDLTFTLVASSLPLADAIDAMQYLDGGPCVQAVHDDAHRVEAVDELLDEDRWALFAQASAAGGREQPVPAGAGERPRRRRDQPTPPRPTPSWVTTATWRPRSGPRPPAR